MIISNRILTVVVATLSSLVVCMPPAAADVAPPISATFTWVNSGVNTKAPCEVTAVGGTCSFSVTMDNTISLDGTSTCTSPLISCSATVSVSVSVLAGCTGLGEASLTFSPGSLGQPNVSNSARAVLKGGVLTVEGVIAQTAPVIAVGKWRASSSEVCGVESPEFPHPWTLGGSLQYVQT